MSGFKEASHDFRVAFLQLAVSFCLGRPFHVRKGNFKNIPQADLCQEWFLQDLQDLRAAAQQISRTVIIRDTKHRFNFTRRNEATNRIDIPQAAHTFLGPLHQIYVLQIGDIELLIKQRMLVIQLLVVLPILRIICFYCVD